MILLDGWENKLQSEAGFFDVIIDGSGGESLTSYFKLINIGGIISMYGSTTGFIKNTNPAILFLKNAELRGTTMGSNKEFKDMVELVNQKKIIPVVDSVRNYSQSKEAFDLMKEGKQFGKIVINFRNSQIKSNL